MKRWSLFVAALTLLPLSGCRDEPPTGPLGGQELWQPVDLGQPAPWSALYAIDFDGEHGAALGVGSFSRQKASSDPIVLAYQDGDWIAATPTDLLGDVIYRDVAVDDAGSLVLAGFANVATDASRLYDARGSITQTFERQGRGLLCVDGDGTFFVAGGASQGGVLWTSDTVDRWTVDDPPLTGTNDSGFRDVYVRGDVAVACGFDDGADTLQVVLRRTASTGWEKIPLDGYFGRTLASVAMNASGAIYLGGIEGAGGLSPRAFLSVRSAGGDWTDIVLPDTGQIGTVNDILPASDGSVYLACSGEIASGLATVVRAHAGGVDREITPFAGELLQLGEGPDGRVYAAGFRRAAGNDATTALILVRPAP